MRVNMDWTVAFVVLIGLGFAAAPVEARSVVFVDDDAPAGGDGASWATAFNQLQHALADSVPGDEIWTAAGTYQPDLGTDQTPGDREATFQLISGVAVYGGLSGDEDSATFDLNDRDFVANETILSGDLAGDDGVEFSNNDENSYHVVTGSGTDETAVMDGFTVAGGNADGGSPHNVGGGMHNESGSPTVTNCTFKGNAASSQFSYGGGMYNMSSSPTLTNCMFNENFASKRGGGIYNILSSSPTIAHCSFNANAADGDGGGMYNESSSSPAMTNCTFSGNTASFGGGMSNVYSCHPTLTNCTFNGNTADGDGGGMFNESSSSPTLTNCTFGGNSASKRGGGIYSGSPTVTNCILWGNFDAGGSDESAQIDGGLPSVAYSCVQGLDTLAGNENIGDDSLLTRNGIHLQVGSPCIDAGDPLGDYIGQTDFDGEQREIGDHVDMGADEFLDTDRDALPDWWEQIHFDSPLAGVASADPDNDGRDNLAEYAGDTDPLRPVRTYYVDLSGDDDWDGLAPVWDGEHGPKATIQAGIDVADQHEGDFVIVASGTYTGAGNRDLDFLGKAMTVQGSDPSDSKMVSATVIDCEGTETDPHRAFRFHSGEAFDSVVAGFTITGGYASEGGAISCRAASPTLTHCAFNGNTAGRGGGMYNTFTSRPLLTHCTFSGNSVVGDGGGMYNNSGSGPTLTDCAFHENMAGTWGDGGGMYNTSSSSPELADCMFSGNTGGGMRNFSSNPTLVNCAFSENPGGGMRNNFSNPALSHCTFIANVGGGMQNFSGSPTLTNCVFSQNMSNRGGGMLNDSNSNPSLTNCTFIQNTAISANSASCGGGMYNRESSPTLTNCSFIGNLADVNVGGICNGLAGSPTLANCILWGNIDAGGADESAQMSGGSPSVAYSCIQGLSTLIGEGNIGDDPLLTGNAIHLPAGSPCVDAGDPQGNYDGQTDVDGEPREIDDIVDMGSDEFLDTDDDEMPDWWEQIQFGSPTDGDASADPDNDGRNNLTEYTGDTNPFEPLRTYHVDLAGNDDWDGLSPTWDGEHGPKATIQAGIDVADPQEGDFVVVAPGTYTGVGNRDLDFSGKAITLRSINPDDSDVVSATVIDCGGTEADPHRAFWFHSNERADSVVTGFTITGGYAVEGGAVSCSFAGPTLTHCAFIGNTAGDKGGGMYSGSGCSSTLTDCEFIANAAKDGGGMYILEGSPMLAGCAFTRNMASSRGGGMYNRGGNLTLTNCTLSGNTASDGGGMVNTFYSSPTLTHCTFSRNSASYRGGGMFNTSKSSPILTNCILWG